MTEGHLDATIMVAYLKQLGRHPEELQQATARTDALLDQIRLMAESCRPGRTGLHAGRPVPHQAAGHKAIMLGIENGYAIGH